MSTKSVAGKSGSAFASPELIGRAIRDSFVKLNPVALMRNPVIFVTEVVAALVTVLFVRDFIAGNPLAFTGQIMAWLWFTVLFANFAEAVAEGRGRAQADSPAQGAHRHGRQAPARSFRPHRL